MIRLPALLAWLAVLAVSFMLPVPAKASVGDGYLRIGPATRSQVAIEASRRKASGNSRPAFIKVGDSNLANHYSMYGLGCYRFRPAGLRPSLVSLVGRYRRVRLPIGDPTSTSPNCNTGPSANSFSRFSFAARGGMTAAYPFVTGAEAGFPCEASTLTCEINAVKPRYALIGFGTNEAQFAAGTTMSDGELAAFALELEEIVRTTRASGVEYDATPIHRCESSHLPVDWSYRPTPNSITSPHVMVSGTCQPRSPGSQSSDAQPSGCSESRQSVAIHRQGTPTGRRGTLISGKSMRQPPAWRKTYSPAVTTPTRRCRYRWRAGRGT